MFRLVDVACDQLDLALDGALVVDLTSLLHTMSCSISPVSRHVHKLLQTADAEADTRALRLGSEVGLRRPCLVSVPCARTAHAA